MNDFTKEELQIIKSWCVSKIDIVGLVNFVATEERELQRKIQSMIDNYCEHTYVFRCHDDTIYCPKCGELLQ